CMSGNALFEREVIVPRNMIYVLGDNRCSSFDSRYSGCIPFTSLKGKLLYIFWSADWDRIGTEF
ncbi:MAG TPA: S26 family signal peptidase, partial [Flavobacteriales bacterium]|nr:S26 family signal peptidase [Flavobacteriales bacterium]